MSASYSLMVLIYSLNVPSYIVLRSLSSLWSALTSIVSDISLALAASASSSRSTTRTNPEFSIITSARRSVKT